MTRLKLFLLQQRNDVDTAVVPAKVSLVKVMLP